MEWLDCPFVSSRKQTSRNLGGQHPSNIERGGRWNGPGELSDYNMEGQRAGERRTHSLRWWCGSGDGLVSPMAALAQGRLRRAPAPGGNAQALLPHSITRLAGSWPGRLQLGWGATVDPQTCRLTTLLPFQISYSIGSLLEGILHHLLCSFSQALS